MNVYYFLNDKFFLSFFKRKMNSDIKETGIALWSVPVDLLTIFSPQIPMIISETVFG